MSTHARRHAQAAKRTRSAAACLALAILALVIPIVTGTGISVAAAATTVTGTVSGDHAWDVRNGKQYDDAPQVSVDQTDNLTDQVVHVSWKNFTPSTDQQGNPQSSYNPGNTYYPVTVVECKGTDPVNNYYVGNYSGYLAGQDCYAYQPSDANASQGVGNEVTTFTGADGSGEAYLHIETAVENEFLGCDATHACSIVVLPTWGGVQPDYAPIGDPSVHCDDHSKDLTGLSQDGLWALDGSLGEACSWSDRLVVPLHFAPTPTDCPSKNFSFASQGAPLLARAMSQWQAGWCTGPGAVNFDYDSGTNEYEARQSFLTGGSGALTSAADVAIVNQPADPTAATARKFTYAPLANTGIAIAFHIDDPRTGKLITDLRLNARLVAKLVTQSYALADYDCQYNTTDPTKQGPGCDPAVRGNPASILADPELLALNPQLTPADFPNGSLAEFPLGSFLPLVVAGNSDMTHELTRWIADDPDAAAFLAGKTDPWGMHINTYYRGVKYPIDQFQVLDPGYTDPKGFPGNGTTQVSWNPLSGMANVVNSLVIDRPSGQDSSSPSCTTDSDGHQTNCLYSRLASIQLGRRGVFAVVGLDDAAADQFPVAGLVNSAGQPVAPTTSSLTAGVRDMTVAPDKITAEVNHISQDAQAYPLTVTEYAMVPTCGLSQPKASGVSNFLNHVANSQIYGSDPGTLAPGNLALTDAQIAQTEIAAQAIGTQPCAPSTSVVGPRGTNTNTHTSSNPSTNPGQPASSVPNPTTTDAGSGPGSSGSNDAGAGRSDNPTSTLASAEPAPSSGQTRATAAPTPQTTPQAFGIKHSDSSNPIDGVLPILLIAAGLLLVAGPVLYLVSLGGGRAAVTGLVRGWIRR